MVTEIQWIIYLLYIPSIILILTQKKSRARNCSFARLKIGILRRDDDIYLKTSGCKNVTRESDNPHIFPTPKSCDLLKECTQVGIINIESLLNSLVICEINSNSCIFVDFALVRWTHVCMIYPTYLHRKNLVFISCVLSCQ